MPTSSMEMGAQKNALMRLSVALISMGNPFAAAGMVYESPGSFAMTSSSAAATSIVMETTSDGIAQGQLDL